MTPPKGIVYPAYDGWFWITQDAAGDKLSEASQFFGTRQEARADLEAHENPTDIEERAAGWGEGGTYA